MVVLFSAIGILLWVGVLLAALVLFGVIWVAGRTTIWIAALIGLLARPNNTAPVASNRNVRPAPRPAAPQRNVTPARKPAAREIMPDIMPKWNAAHRRYVDSDLADWQKQFDALSSRKL